MLLPSWQWLMLQRGRNDPVGDVASDAYDTRAAFPQLSKRMRWNSTVAARRKAIRRVRFFLWSCNACYGTERAFAQSVGE